MRARNRKFNVSEFKVISIDILYWEIMENFKLKEDDSRHCTSESATNLSSFRNKETQFSQNQQHNGSN